MTSGSISCDTEVVGLNESPKNGNKMAITSQLDKDQTVLCPYGYCYEQQLALIKRKILLKFQSIPFSLDIKLSNGTIVSITALFCSFGSGKNHTS